MTVGKLSVKACSILRRSVVRPLCLFVGTGYRLGNTSLVAVLFFYTLDNTQKICYTQTQKKYTYKKRRWGE